jgi:hypothetical protein
MLKILEKIFLCTSRHSLSAQKVLQKMNIFAMCGKDKINVKQKLILALNCIYFTQATIDFFSHKGCGDVCLKFCFAFFDIFEIC